MAVQKDGATVNISWRMSTVAVSWEGEEQDEEDNRDEKSYDAMRVSLSTVMTTIWRSLGEQGAELISVSCFLAWYLTLLSDQTCFKGLSRLLMKKK